MFFLQKAPSWMLDWVLNTPLDWPWNLFREFLKILKNNCRQNSRKKLTLKFILSKVVVPEQFLTDSETFFEVYREYNLSWNKRTPQSNHLLTVMSRYHWAITEILISQVPIYCQAYFASNCKYFKYWKNIKLSLPLACINHTRVRELIFVLYPMVFSKNKKINEYISMNKIIVSNVHKWLKYNINIL